MKFISKTFSIIILFITLIACNGGNSKIVGKWERVDRKIDATETFLANGDYSISNPAITFTGKYEIKDGILIIKISDKDGRLNPFDSKYKIIEITDDSMLYQSQDGTKMNYRKLN